MLKLKLLIISFLLLALPVSASRKYPERAYQDAWCSLRGGVQEYKNEDYTRVDCLTETHAVEFDFAKKWAEGVGQALYYGLMTGKKPMVVLIFENPDKDIKYFNRAKKLANKYDFEVECVDDSIFCN